jgi:hypothetical protein
MRIRLLVILLATAASVLAFTIPGREPVAEFVGRVLATEKMNHISVVTNASGGLELTHAKLSEVSKDTTTHWELWKAEVQVQQVAWVTPDRATNLADRVSVYYHVVWSTNFTTPYGAEAGLAPRRGLSTNHIYMFLCCPSDVTNGETNAFHAYDIGIIPQ